VNTLRSIRNFFNSYHIGFLSYIIVVLVLFLMTFMVHDAHILMHVPLLLAFVPICTVAFKKLKEKKIETEFFLVIATAISFLGDQEQAMMVVLLIMLFAHYLEDVITDRTNKAIEQLIHLIPSQVLVKINGQEKLLSIQEVRVGMTVIVQTGGRIPVDGVIQSGQAAINEASLTGESVPVEKKEHDRVFAGTFVEGGSIIVTVEKIGEDTFFGKIVELVQRAEEKKAPISLLADTVAFYLVPSVLLFIFLVWAFTGNVQLVITLLVFGSPLELTLIPPLAILAAIIAAFKNGVLIKGGKALELFGYTTVMIFDKTGTLTLGEPTIAEITVFEPTYTQKDIIKIAAIAEKRAAHAFARGIAKKAQQEQIVIPDPQAYESIAGHGVVITYDHKRWFLGNKHFIQAPEHGNSVIPQAVIDSENKDYSCFYLGSQGKVYARICSVDAIRTEAKESIALLGTQGIQHIQLVSGDKQEVVDTVARALGIAHAQGGVFPDQKLRMIQSLQKAGSVVAMVGDGINDAPALRQADVGIAMGAMGMQPAIEAADIVLTTNDLEKIVFIHALSKKTITVIRHNIIIGFVIIHLFGMALAFLQLLTPIQAALFHAIPDLAILINSSRLMRFRVKK
jgi:heavy metal translocating P-type ATPase